MALFIVTNANDDGAGSLRKAIEDAETNGITPDTIKFASSMSGETIYLASNLIIASGTVSIEGDIDGDGDADITISGDTGQDGVPNPPDLDILLRVGSGATAAFDSVKFASAVSDARYSSPGQFGIAGIMNYGNLTLSNSELKDFSARGANGDASYGGARAIAGILNYNSGGTTLTLTDTIVENMYASGGNNAGYSGGGAEYGGNVITGIFNLYGTVSLTRVAVRDSNAYGGDGYSGAPGSGGNAYSGFLNRGGGVTGTFGTHKTSSSATGGYPGGLYVEGTYTTAGGTSDPESLTDPSIGSTGIDTVDVGGGLTFLGFGGDDQIFNTAGGGKLFGHDGDDIISTTGTGGRAYGGGGDDSIIADNGARAYGGKGDDFIRPPTLLASVTLDGGDGVDTLDMAYQTGKSLTFDLMAGTASNGASILNFENMRGTDDGTQSDTILGTDGINTILGMKGNDTISGRGGNDAIDGGKGKDEINGGSGKDTLLGDLGNDTLRGDGGNDLIGGGDGDDLIFGGAGNDQLTGQADNDTIRGGGGKDTIAGDAGNDKLFGDAGIDTIAGNAGADTIKGGGGNDIIGAGGGKDNVGGGAGNDLILGHSGNDVLQGDSGKDKIGGGGGNDKIAGGKGQDLTKGDAGNDRFVFANQKDSGTTKKTQDKIKDFDDKGNDVIDLKGFNGTLTYLGTGALTGKNQVHVEKQGKHVLVEVSTDNDAAAEFSVLLLNTKIGAIGADDFIL